MLSHVMDKHVTVYKRRGAVAPSGISNLAMEGFQYLIAHYAFSH